MATTDAPDATLTIDPVAPFDFQQSLAFLQGFPPCAGDHRCDAGVLTSGGYAGDDPFLVRVSEDTNGTLAVDVEWLDAAGDLDAVASWLREFLSLDDDLTGFYETAADDPAFEPVVEALHGYHHVRFSRPFEAACWAALSQRTPRAVSKRLTRSLVSACGRVVTVAGEEIQCFPTPARVRDRSAAVEDAIDHDRKAKTVLAAAEAFATEELAALDDDALRSRLAEIWGFGEWSSEFVALRGFGRLSRLPRTELRLREVVAEVYDIDAPEATDTQLERLSAPYEPLVGYWAHYLRVWASRISSE